MNKILQQLNRGAVKAIAYSDDLVILLSGPFIDTISNIMKRALRRLNDWAKSCGLRVNPTKTELMFFTRRAKIPNFSLPKLSGKRLELSSKANKTPNFVVFFYKERMISLKKYVCFKKIIYL